MHIIFAPLIASLPRWPLLELLSLCAIFQIKSLPLQPTYSQVFL